MQQNYPEEWGSEDDRVADAVAKLTALAATGVRTVVDPTVMLVSNPRGYFDNTGTY